MNKFKKMMEIKMKREKRKKIQKIKKLKIKRLIKDTKNLFKMFKTFLEKKKELALRLSLLLWNCALKFPR